MNKVDIKRTVILIISSFVLIVIDQYIKYIATTYLKPISNYDVIKDIFSLTYIENNGAAFGLFAGNKFLLIWLTGFVILGLIIYTLMNKIKHNLMFISIILIVSGGVGNLIDRINLGYVVDYLHITCINFAIFNFADCLVVCGTILLIIYFMFFDDKVKSRKTVMENTDE